MSWASKRETSRPEDIAYYLLGIFDVNMPLLYGEGGTKAFFRLQEEIIRNSNDESIFAWGEKDFDVDDEPSLFPDEVGVLAEQPASFIDASKIEPSERHDEPYFMTNLGLSISLPILPSSLLSESLTCWSGLYRGLPEYAILNYHYYDDFRGPLCLELAQFHHLFCRTPRKPFRIDSSLAAKAKKRSLFISRSSVRDTYFGWKSEKNYNSFWIRTKIVSEYAKIQPLSIQGFPSEFWNIESAVLSRPASETPRGAALVNIGGEQDHHLQFAVIFQGVRLPWIKLLLRDEFDEWINDGGLILEDEFVAKSSRQSDNKTTSSVQLSSDVQIVATIKRTVLMGKDVAVIELVC